MILNRVLRIGTYPQKRAPTKRTSFECEDNLVIKTSGAGSERSTLNQFLYMIGPYDKSSRA
jgi:hypothetical protein